MPREPLDAPEDLPKETPSQVAFGQLENEVPGMPDPLQIENAGQDRLVVLIEQRPVVDLSQARHRVATRPRRIRSAPSSPPETSRSVCVSLTAK
jgi:hypothetical protein